MTTAVKAVYEDGVFKPKEPVQLEEKTEVEVLIPAEPRPDDDGPTGWKTARELIGCITEELVEHRQAPRSAHLPARSVT
jgi:predicted DNA-binding antitoxin AbrB/MazE fold protein